MIDADEREEERRAAEAAVIAGFAAALAELVEMRRREGEALGRILARGSTRSRRLPRAPKPRPAASPRRSRRARRAVAALMDASDRFDPDRLHQEAILIATKADMREELDRLPPMWRRRQADRARAARSGGGSISCRRNSTAKRIRCAPSRTTWS